VVILRFLVAAAPADVGQVCVAAVFEANECGLQRYVDILVVVPDAEVFELLTFCDSPLQHADDAQPGTATFDPLANGVAGAEVLPQYVLPDDADRIAPLLVDVVKHRPPVKAEVIEFEESIGNADGSALADLPVPNNGSRKNDLRTHCRYAGKDGGDGPNIPQREAGRPLLGVLVLACGLSLFGIATFGSFHQAGHYDVIGSDETHLGQDGFPSSSADGEHGDHCRYAENDAQGSQEGPQPVGRYAFQG
jgi:hypothetical protein